MNANKMGWQLGTGLIFTLSGVILAVANYNNLPGVGVAIACGLNWIGYVMMDKHAKA
jgi:drug/metabolite transporter (DMT)-like permease